MSKSENEFEQIEPVNQQTIDAINSFHRSIVGKTRALVEDCVEMGRRLSEAQRTVGYGRWEFWVPKNLDMSARQARRYMYVYTKRDLVKPENLSTSDTMSDLIRVIQHAEFDVGRVERVTKKILPQDAREAEMTAQPEKTQLLAALTDQAAVYVEKQKHIESEKPRARAQDEAWRHRIPTSFPGARARAFCQRLSPP
jgi:hypothetical protein